MNARKPQRTIVVDAYTRFCLTAIVVLLTVLIVALWASGPDLAGDCTAAVKRTPVKVLEGQPNAWGQRQKIVESNQSNGRKLDRIIGLLESGKLTVVVANLEGKDVGKNAKKR